MALKVYKGLLGCQRFKARSILFPTIYLGKTEFCVTSIVMSLI